MKKRLLALILCLVMVIGLVPTALAADGDDLQIRFAANLDKVPNDDGLYGPVYTATVKQGATAALTDLANVPTPVKDGYTFLGWSAVNGDKVKIVDFDGNYLYPTDTATLTLYGIWEVNSNPNPDPTPVKHTITYKWSETSAIFTAKEVEDEADHSVIAYPREWQTPEKKVFDHWTDGIKEYKPGDTIGAVRGDMTLYAVYADTSATVCTVAYEKAPNLARDTFQVVVDQNVVIDPNGGAYVDANDAANNGKTNWFVLSITKNTVIGSAKAVGKTFIGWEKGTYEGADDVVKLTAQWKEDAKEHTVKFYCWYHEAKNETLKLAHNTKIVIDPNGGKFKYNGSYTTDRKAFYLTSDYTIANAERTGYTFYGWYAVEDNVTGTLFFTAQWTKDYPYYKDYTVYYYDYDEGKYAYAEFDRGTTLVFDANGGSAKLNGTKFTSTKSVDIAQDYTLSDAERAGYTFYGWDLTKSGSKYYFTAMWARKSSTVPYMLNGSDHFAYIKGYPNGTIRPDATITRAEVATIFYRLLTDNVRKNYGTSKNSFKDVPANAWYNTAVSTIANLGIITGDANGYFRPTDSITRAELAAMIARCDGGYYTGSGYYFSDTKGHWAADYIARAYDLGWINGYGDTYAPDRKVTRAETMAVLNRVLNRAPQYTSDLLNGMNTFSDNQKTSAWYYLDVQEATNSHTYTRKTNSDYEYWNKLVANPSWY